MKIVCLAWAGAILATLLWLLMAICVALPALVLNGEVENVAHALLNDRHMMFIGVLFLVDVFIMVVLVPDKAATRRFQSWLGKTLAFASAFAFIMVMVVVLPYQPVWFQSHPVFFACICLVSVGIVRLMTYSAPRRLVPLRES